LAGKEVPSIGNTFSKKKEFLTLYNVCDFIRGGFLGFLDLYGFLKKPKKTQFSENYGL